MRGRSRDPESVFTPKAIVSREMFARRNEPDLSGKPGVQDVLRDALKERGGQVLVYGDTGVGKSSLLRYAAEDEHMKSVTIECLSSASYEELIDAGIRKLVDVREDRRTASGSVGSSLEGSASRLLLSIKGSIKAEYGKTRHFEVIAKPPLDTLISAMTTAGVSLLVFDNFQNVTAARSKLLIAQTMEFMSDRADGTNDIKTVIVGIAEDASGLLGGAGSFVRRTNEVGVPRMPDDEIKGILSTGFGLLSLHVDAAELNAMTFYADGFPFFAHVVGLHAAREARRRQVDTVGHTLVEASLLRVAQAVERSLADRLAQAFEAGGDIQPRRRVLLLLAKSGQREWRSLDVTSAYASTYEAREDYAFLHVALAQLTDRKYGSVLLRRGTRGRFVYRFADPHIRPYLRINGAMAADAGKA